jgi:hypothetical protein
MGNRCESCSFAIMNTSDGFMYRSEAHETRSVGSPRQRRGSQHAQLHSELCRNSRTPVMFEGWSPAQLRLRFPTVKFLSGCCNDQFQLAVHSSVPRGSLSALNWPHGYAQTDRPHCGTDIFADAEEETIVTVLLKLQDVPLPTFVQPRFTPGTA